MKKITTLVISGSGIKSIACIGILKFLEKNDIIKGIKSFTGTSAGALVSALIILGYTSDELYNVVLNIPFHELHDISIKGLFENYSIDTRKNIDTLIESFIINKGYNKEITLKEFYLKTNLELNIIVTNLNKYKYEIFNYKTQPNISLIDALLMSLNIPILWKKIIYNGDYYIDGYMTNNLALDIYTDTQLKHTLAIYFKSHNTFTGDTFINYIYNIFYCLSSGRNEVVINKYISDPKYNIIVLDINQGSTDFNLNRETINKMIKTGYHITKKYFEK